MKKGKVILESTDVILTLITAVLIVSGVLIILSGKNRPEKASGVQFVTESVSTPLVSAANLDNGEVYPFAGKIDGSGVRLREKPSTETGRIIRELNDAVRVEVIAKEGSWYLVRHRDDVGYIYEDYVSHASKT